MIYGYLVLAINLKKNKKLNGEAFNFGYSQDKNVISLLKEIKTNWNSVKWKIKKNKTFKESNVTEIKFFEI